MGLIDLNYVIDNLNTYKNGNIVNSGEKGLVVNLFNLCNRSK